MSFINYLIVLVFTSTYSIQEWKVRPRDDEVNPGDNTTLFCGFRNIAGDCRWEKDGTPVGMFPGKYSWAGNLTDGDCSINIYHVEREFDHGGWQCSVTATSFRSKDALVSDEVSLLVRRPPTSVILRQGDSKLSGHVQVGEEVNETISCAGEGGEPPPTLSWKLPKSINQYSVYEAEGSSLLTVRMNRGLSGSVIQCIANHPALGQPILATLAVHVQYIPSISIEFEKNFTKIKPAGPGYKITAQEDERMVLRCLADGNPQPKVIWRKESTMGEWKRGEEIVFKRISKEDRGIYSCLAQNQLGVTGPNIIQLDVQYPPTLVSTSPSAVTRARVGTSQTFMCSGDGNPAPLYQWSHNLNGQRKIRGNERSLNIYNISWSDTGDYICTASNSIGGVERHSESLPISLQVYGSPEIYSDSESVEAESGSDVKLEVSFCGHPRPDVKWVLGNLVLSPGSRHGRYISEVLHDIPGYEFCYKSWVYILAVTKEDTDSYSVYVENQHGLDSAALSLQIQETDYLLAIVCGVVAGSLLLVLLLFLLLHLRKPCSSWSSHPHTEIASLKTEYDSTLGSGIFLPSTFSSSQDCTLQAPSQLHTFNTFKKGRKVYEDDILCGKYSVQSATIHSGNPDLKYNIFNTPNQTNTLHSTSQLMNGGSHMLGSHSTLGPSVHMNSLHSTPSQQLRFQSLHKGGRHSIDQQESVSQRYDSLRAAARERGRREPRREILELLGGLQDQSKQNL